MKEIKVVSVERYCHLVSKLSLWFYALNPCCQLRKELLLRLNLELYCYNLRETHPFLQCWHAIFPGRLYANFYIILDQILS